MTINRAHRADLETLRGLVAGSVECCGDNTAVVIADSVADIVAVVRFARANRMRVAPRRIGRTSSLPALANTIALQTSRLRDVDIDTHARRARIEAGARWDDVVGPAAAHGFMVLHGMAPDAGVAGFTLGGGWGWLARSRGLAANAVTAVEVVTADGRVVWADRDTEADLFWAVRGGGDVFGVVTAIEVQLLPTPELYAGSMTWPATRSRSVLRAWRTWAVSAPDEITSTLRVTRLPRDGVVVDAVYTGPEQAGAALLTPLRALEPAVDTFARVGAPDLLRVRSAMPAAVEIRHLGGALARPAPGHGAAGASDAQFLLIRSGIAPRPTRSVETTARLHKIKMAYDPNAVFTPDPL